MLLTTNLKVIEYIVNGSTAGLVKHIVYEKNSGRDLPKFIRVNMIDTHMQVNFFPNVIKGCISVL